MNNFVLPRAESFDNLDSLLVSCCIYFCVFCVFVTRRNLFLARECLDSLITSDLLHIMESYIRKMIMVVTKYNSQNGYM